MMTSKGRVNIFLEDEDEEEEGEILNSSRESNSSTSNSTCAGTTSSIVASSSSSSSRGYDVGPGHGHGIGKLEIDKQASSSSSSTPMDKINQLSSKWLFTPLALNNSPSIQRGMTPEDQDILRKAGIAFIVRLHRDVQASKRLLLSGEVLSSREGLQPQYKNDWTNPPPRDDQQYKNDWTNPPPRVLCTAAVYFHRFFFFHPFQLFHPYEIGATCYYLATKVEEVPQTIVDILRYTRRLFDRAYKTGTIFDRIIPSGVTEELLNEVKETICSFENILLQTLSFEVAVELPFNYHADKCMTGFKAIPAEVFSRLKRRLHYYYEQSLNTTICLQWNAKTYAMALVILACNKEKVPVKIWKNLIINPDHYVLEGFIVTRNTVREICDTLNSYSLSKNQPCDVMACINVFRKYLPSASASSSSSDSEGSVSVSLNPEVTSAG